MAEPRSQRPGVAGVARAAGVVLAASLALGCGKKQAAAPDWVASSPGDVILGISGQAGWILEQPGFQAQMAKFPYADQTLDLFLRKAHISPHQETGRISFYAMRSGEKPRVPAQEAPTFLIQLGGFKDQASLSLALSESFPAEGTLSVDRHQLPTHAILEVGGHRFAAITDLGGRVWMGDRDALSRLDAEEAEDRGAVLSAVEWINRSAPFQGFLRPGPFLKEMASRGAGDLGANLPPGVEALAWSVTPGAPGRGGLHRFELALCGTPEAVQQVAPWVQRFAAAANALQAAPGAQAPEILQERRRLGLRCQLTSEQINQALGRICQPRLNFQATLP